MHAAAVTVGEFETSFSSDGRSLMRIALELFKYKPALVSFILIASLTQDEVRTVDGFVRNR